MRRHPSNKEDIAFALNQSLVKNVGDLGLVLSGGGSRAAYQVGALRALAQHLESGSLGSISTIVGSSIGAVNGLLIGACLKDGINSSVQAMENLWAERTFRNTFSGSPSMAFFRAIGVAVTQYLSPGPKGSDNSIFDPSPLMKELDEVILSNGGTSPENRIATLKSLAVMTTIEGKQRKPLLFLSASGPVDPERMLGASFEISYVKNLTAKYGFASAALPSVLPPVELDTEHGKVKLVDGGISQNHPVDPAVRLGAERIIMLDVSGRDWWHDRYSEPHDKRPSWEVPAGSDTFCFRPPEIFVVRCQKPLGPILKNSVAYSTKKFMAAVGPVWPVFTLLRKKLGEEVAYETMTYVALDKDYIMALMERGYNEANALLKKYNSVKFERLEKAK